MKMKPLGRTDMMVSELCLGTMTWGQQNSLEEGHAQMDWAQANGINFFDVAEMYPSAPNEPATRARPTESLETPNAS